MKIYVAIPHGSPPEAYEHLERQRDRYVRPRGALEPAHMVYRIRGTRLYLARGSKYARGGVMVIGTSTYTGGGPAEPLLDDITAELKERNFEGVLLDTGGSAAPIQTTLAGRIVTALRPYPVYMPAPLSQIVTGSVALVQTALSGGELWRHIETAVNRFGAGNIALECDRVRMDFKLPCRAGIGDALTDEEFMKLTAAHGTHSFFSEKLCTSYFTYKSGKNRHMVLFDDAMSIKRKLALGERLGVSRAFLYYPHISDIMMELI